MRLKILPWLGQEFVLHRDESLPQLRERFQTAIDARIPSVDYTFVDSRQGKRLEIELTARIGRAS